MSEVNSINNDMGGTSPVSDKQARCLAHEYGQLLIKDSLSDTEDARIDELLHLATVHDNVDHYISEATLDYGRLIGLLSPEALSYYEDQRAVLRERLGLSSEQDDAGNSDDMTLLNELDAALRQFRNEPQEHATDDSTSKTAARVTYKRKGRKKGAKGVKQRRKDKGKLTKGAIDK